MQGEPKSPPIVTPPITIPEVPSTFATSTIDLVRDVIPPLEADGEEDLALYQSEPTSKDI